MKKTPLKRKKTLERQVPMKAGKPPPKKRKERRRSSRVYNPHHLVAVKQLPCFLVNLGAETPCGGVTEADHVGERGLGQKCSDDETIPLCTYHHRERTDFSGYFRDFSKDDMRIWCAAALRVTNHRLRFGVVLAPPEAEGDAVDQGDHPVTGREADEAPVVVEEDRELEVDQGVAAEPLSG